MALETAFLDAGGVLLFPNFERVSTALARRGVKVEAGALARAELAAKRKLDVADTIRATNDTERGWLYFNLILEEAGIELDRRTDAALAELHEYHAEHNLWEVVPSEVVPALVELRGMGMRLVVVSNANGRLRRVFDRVGLTRYVDVLFDSHEVGVEKPDPRLFQIALTQSGARTDTTVHVGDLYHVDVVGARAAGLEAVLLDLGGLYEDFDCLRVRSLAGLPQLLLSGITR